MRGIRDEPNGPTITRKFEGKQWPRRYVNLTCLILGFEVCVLVRVSTNKESFTGACKSHDKRLTGGHRQPVRYAIQVDVQDFNTRLDFVGNLIAKKFTTGKVWVTAFGEFPRLYRREWICGMQENLAALFARKYE